MMTDLHTTAIESTALVLSELRQALDTLDAIEKLAAQFRTCSTLDEGRSALEADVMPAWPRSPTSIQHQTRNGGTTEYMYLYWPRDRRTGDYLGPPNKNGVPARKTYIGANPDAQGLATTMITHQQRLAALQREAARLFDGLVIATDRISSIQTTITSCHTQAIKRLGLGGKHEPLSAYH